MKVFVIALLVAAATAHAGPDHVAYVAGALAAVHDLGAAGRDRLERDIHTAARERCHAERAAPAPDCLIAAATELCKGDSSCVAAADVVITNERAANDWVDEATRMRLVRASADYGSALHAELHRRFAALAAELVFARGRDAAAPEIDRLCRDRDRRIHACEGGDPTCIPSVPWSRCVAALVWFVGSAP